MNSSSVHPVQSAAVNGPQGKQLFGEKIAIALMIIGTFFLLVPVIIWATRGVFPDKTVNVVLGVIGTILLLVSILILKAALTRTRRT